MIASKDTHPLLFLTSKGLNDPLGRHLFKSNIFPERNDKALLISIEEYGVGDTLIKACIEIGFREENVSLCETTESVAEHLSSDYVTHPSANSPYFAMIYIGEGNTYQLLDLITKDHTGKYTDKFLHFLKSEIEKGAIYCGASAGAAIVGVDIKLIKEYAEKERNFSGITSLEGIGAFPGSIIPHYTKEDFIRFFYSKTIREIEEEKTRYSQLGWVDNESILVLDPEETTHLLSGYYQGVETINDLEFFLETTSNFGADILLYDGRDYEVKKVSFVQKSSDCYSDSLCLNGTLAYLIPKNNTEIYRIYTLNNKMFGFRVIYQNQQLDIMVCTTLTIC